MILWILAALVVVNIGVIAWSTVTQSRACEQNRHAQSLTLGHNTQLAEQAHVLKGLDATMSARNAKLSENTAELHRLNYLIERMGEKLFRNDGPPPSGNGAKVIPIDTWAEWQRDIREAREYHRR